MEHRIFSSRLLSQLGDLFFNSIIDIWILNTFNSSATLGTSLAIASSANFIASFFGGYIADSKYLNKSILISEFLSFGISLVNIVYLYLVHKPSILIINIFLFLLNFNGFLLSPLIKKIISLYILKDRVPKFNQVLSISGQMLNVVIPAIATYLYSRHFLSIISALLINAASFLIALLVLLPLINVNNVEQYSDNKYRTAFKYLLSNHRLQSTIIWGMFLSLFGAELGVFFPVFVSKTLKLQSLYGTVISFQAIGGIWGALSLRFIKISKKMSSEIYLLFFVIFSLLFTIFTKNIYATYLLSFITNFVLVRYGIFSQTFIQTSVPTKFIGKTFSILFFCLNLVMPVGSFVLGKALSYSNELTILLLLFPLLISILVLFIYKKKI